MKRRKYVSARKSNRIFRKAYMNRRADKVKLYRGGERII